MQFSNMTAESFDRSMAPVASKGIIVRFEYERFPLINPGDSTLNGTVQNRLVMVKTVKGDRSTTSRTQITPAEAQRRYPQEWMMFTTYGDAPTYGTSLSELPGVTQSSIAMLQLHNVRSIEDLAEIQSETLSKISLEAVKSQRLAKVWLAKQKDSATDIDQSSEIAALQAELENRKAREEQAAEAMRALEARLAAQEALMQTPAGVSQASAPAVASMMPDAASAAVDDGVDEPDDSYNPMAEGPAEGGAVNAMTEEMPDPLAGD